MKKILLTAIVLAAFTTTQAQSPLTTRGERTSAKAIRAMHKKVAPAPVVKAATAAATDDSAGYVGTNDFYLALIREGVRKG